MVARVIKNYIKENLREAAKAHCDDKELIADDLQKFFGDWMSLSNLTYIRAQLEESFFEGTLFGPLLVLGTTAGACTQQSLILLQHCRWGH